MVTATVSTLWASGETPSGDTDEAAIRALPERIGDAWRAGDAAAVAAVFSDNGDLVAGEGSHVQGRDEIARFMRDVFSRFPPGMRLRTEAKSLRFLRPDVAVLQTVGGFLMPEEAHLPAERLGVQSFVAVKEKGSWRIALFQNTRIQAPPGPDEGGR